MKCPNCGCNIPDPHKEMSAKGGRSSKRKITPEQQAKMQATRQRNKLARDQAKSNK
jgi:hypothetical protein